MRGNNSSDCTNHNYNTRSRTLSEETTTTGRTTARNTWQESTRMRKAFFSPHKTCPVPTNELENYRRTIVKDWTRTMKILSTTTTETSPTRTSLDRRVMVQAEV